MKLPKTFALTALTLGLSTAAVANEVIRYQTPGSTFPIAQAVEIPAGSTLIYHSGIVPGPANRDAEPGTREYWGDTEAQTLSVLARIDESIRAKGLTMGDVVKMQVFLVGDPELEGRMDFEGMMRAYRKYFGTEAQPNLPARSAMQIAGLIAPGMLVEIEVALVRPPANCGASCAPR
jgi:enamine deaminase RidA (YjgF/YER057c/UK114 family)